MFGADGNDHHSSPVSLSRIIQLGHQVDAYSRRPIHFTDPVKGVGILTKVNLYLRPNATLRWVTRRAPDAANDEELGEPVEDLAEFLKAGSREVIHDDEQRLQATDYEQHDLLKLIQDNDDDDDLALDEADSDEPAEQEEVEDFEMDGSNLGLDSRDED